MTIIWTRLLLVAGALTLRGSAQEVNPVVDTAQGPVRGTREKVEISVYSAFRGIPYAKPPTGELRFKAPEKPERWSSPLDATRFKAACPQLDLKTNIVTDEDCLFINVFTPKQLGGDQSIQIQSDLPVMVFIHGGEFQRGSANPYGPELLIQAGVVVVTFNYRLGILGFLSTGDSACPGNLGLRDQAMALQWVQDNIQYFGGRRDLVTIFGQDAGAASVFLHILSPKSKDLFQHAITQSGSPLCDWSIEEEPYKYAVDVAKRLDCTTKTTWKMVECLRWKPVAEILAIQKSNKEFGPFPIRTLPVVDRNDGFLPDLPAKLLESGGYRTPLISGVNTDDGSVFYSLIESHKEDIRKDADYLKRDIVQKFLSTVTDMRGNAASVTQVIMFEYFNEVDPSNMTHVISAFVNMTTDSMFVSCNHKTLQLYSATGAPTYMYNFAYKGENNMLKIEQREQDFPGVAHGDELLYLFNFENNQLTTTNDKKISNILLSLWTNFAQTGRTPDNPTYNMPKWEPYTKNLENYYSLRLDDVQLLTSYRQRASTLWMDLLPALSKVTVDVETKIGALGWSMLAVAVFLAVVAGILGYHLFKKSKSRYFQATPAVEMK